MSTPTVNYAGVDLPVPEEGEVALGAVVLMKVLTVEGHVQYREFNSKELHPVEALGMADTFADSCRIRLNKAARPR